jgi:glycosyltransferase involved in cell wall biosynthesis
VKILIIHTKYQQHGGEDTVARQELELLRRTYQVETLFFQNKGGARGAFQFLLSIWNVFAGIQLREKIRSFQPDVIHVHNWHFASGPIVFRVAKKMGIPVVHTIHNYRLLCPSAILLHENELFTESLTQNFPWTAVQKKVYRNSIIQTFWLAFVIWFHKKIGTWKMVNTHICLTDFAVELFQQSNFGIERSKFVVKPNFTVAPSVQMTNLRGNHFLFVGRLSEEKGILTLLKAFKELPYELRIAGDGPLLHLVKTTARETNNIVYLGTLSRENVLTELVKSQALAFPSICFEGLPMTIIESFSCSTPVITSNLGAMSSLIENQSNGLHFEAGNTNSLKQVILKFVSLSDSEKIKMQQNALHSYQENFSAAKQVDYFKTIYDLSISNKQ